MESDVKTKLLENNGSDSHNEINILKMRIDELIKENDRLKREIQKKSSTVDSTRKFKVTSSNANSTPSTEEGVNWDDGNITTLNTWIKESNEQQFVYDLTLDMIVKKSKLIKTIILIISAIQTLISVSNLGINGTEHPTIVLVINIFTSVIATVVSVLTQYTIQEGYEDNIKSYTVYSENIGNFLSGLVSTAELKIGLRPDGDVFILSNKDSYSDIFSKSPYIDRSQWENGIKKYNSYISSSTTNANRGIGFDSIGSNYFARKMKAYSSYILSNGNQHDTFPAITPTTTVRPQSSVPRSISINPLEICVDDFHDSK